MMKDRLSPYQYEVYIP